MEGRTVLGHFLFGWPHLEYLDHIDDPVVLTSELVRIRTEHTTVHLHRARGPGRERRSRPIRSISLGCAGDVG